MPHEALRCSTAQQTHAGAREPSLARPPRGNAEGAHEGRLLSGLHAAAAATLFHPAAERLEQGDLAGQLGQAAGDQLLAGGEQLAAYKREHLAPGEMERISVPKVLLEKADGEITVSVEEA